MAGDETKSANQQAKRHRVSACRNDNRNSADERTREARRAIGSQRNNNENRGDEQFITNVF